MLIYQEVEIQSMILFDLVNSQTSAVHGLTLLYGGL